MSSIRKVVPLLVVVTLLSKIFGAGRDLVLSYYYGSSNISDAYLLATTIPVTIFSFIYEGIAASFIPACTRLNTKREQNLFTSNLINILLLISCSVIALIELFPEYSILIFASGFDDKTLSIACEILQISVLGVIFSAISYVFVSYLNYNNSFISAAARAIPMDIVVILSIVISAKYNNSITILSIGIVVSLLAAFLFLLPDLKKTDWHYYRILNLRDSNMRAVFSWSLPVVLSMALADINSIVDRQFASYLSVGGISAITYSSRLISIVSALFFAPLLTFLFPGFSKNIQAGKIGETQRVVDKVLRHLMIISLPILMFMSIMSPEIVHIVFERGAFDSKASMMTSDCLRNYSFSIFATAVIMVTTKIFYSFADMWTPMKISIAGVISNVIGNFVFSFFCGLPGLPLSSSCSLTIVAFLQLMVITKKLKISKTSILKLFLKITLITIIIGFVVSLFDLYANFSGVVSLLITILITMLLYPLMLIILKVDEYRTYFDIVNKMILELKKVIK